MKFNFALALMMRTFIGIILILCSEAFCILFGQKSQTRTFMIKSKLKFLTFRKEVQQLFNVICNAIIKLGSTKKRLEIHNKFHTVQEVQ